MSQRSFASAEYAMKNKRTRRKVLFAELERMMPWLLLAAVIELLYFTRGCVRCQPVGVFRILRMYCLKQWHGLVEEALEDARYDSQAMRDFLGIDLSRESVPDATTLLKFRRLLLANDLTKAPFDEITAQLEAQGPLMRAGTIVDATIIAVSSSTKNAGNARNGVMHRTKKGNAWHLGMKTHIGVDTSLQLMHMVVNTATNVSDVTQTGCAAARRCRLPERAQTRRSVEAVAARGNAAGPQEAVGFEAQVSLVA